MQTTLRHAIAIDASRTVIYHALTNIDAVRAWHVGAVDGAIAPQQVLTMTPHAGLRFSWRTIALKPERAIVQTCIEGPGTSTGKMLTFQLSDAINGRTVVELTDGEWEDDDPHLPFCNTHWGKALMRLKNHIESR